MPAEQLDRGIRTLYALHARVGELLEGRLRRTLERDDYGYAGWYIHLRTPALVAIASEGWVDGHLHDFALLAESPALGDCCRATVIDLFGVECFHVAIQHYPVSDGLVQVLCHEPGDKVQRIRRIAGQLVFLRSVCGSYPPPGIYPENASSVDSPAFDAIPAG
jgi:hypothetical protein